MKKYKGIEKRKYIRLQSVYPVEFHLLSLDGRKNLSDPIQGFTSDVSKGGILLSVNNLDPKLSKMLAKGQAKMELSIEIPLRARPIEAVSLVAWMSEKTEEERDQCMIGLSFEKIAEKDRRRLVGYALSLYRVPRLTAVALIILLAALGVERVEEINLRKQNTVLIEDLRDVLKKRSAITGWLDESKARRSALAARLETQKGDIIRLEEDKRDLLKRDKELRVTIEDMAILKSELDNSREAQAALAAQLQRITGDKESLQEKIAKIREDEEARRKELEKIDISYRLLERATADNMQNWLKVHQNKKTALISSYEGDRSLGNIAFTYDQSLVAQVFMLSGDLRRAESIFNFFQYRAKKNGGSFSNAYDANTGGVIEHAVHCGPNIWLGIALMQYMNKTASREYLGLAEGIADWVLKIQNEDPAGGIRGGPNVTWFSTEHNLDAYAFYMMLAKETGKDKYKVAADKSLKWLKDNAFTGNEGRVQRGKGDSTIATDTFSWAIAAIGPALLMEEGLDPDAIMKFAEDNCVVTVDFERPNEEIVKITGFDFAKHRNIARKGVVSSEWTAQMIVSFKMMSDFYLKMGDNKKAAFYRKKGLFYMNELEKMLISSSSRTGQGAGCLPYATQDNVDTGHGWRTPHGRDTGSVSGTAYAIFAIKGYNPLKLEKKN